MRRVTKHESCPLVAGWRLLWQTQRIMWWIYAVNLVLGFLAATGFSLRVGRVLDHSLAADRLYHAFDLSYVIELLSHPDVQFAARPTNSLAFASIFFIFMLFATGGIIESYVRNRMLVPGEFFQGCGAFFWRLVRLWLWLLAALAPIAVLAMGGNKLLPRLLRDASEKAEFFARLAGWVVLALALMIVRLWFDMAQVRTVAEDDRGVTRTLGRAFKLTFSNFSALFTIYLLPSLLAWAGSVVAITIWVRFVPANRLGLSFLLGQFVAWLWIATRLWQRASEVIWYQRAYPQPTALPAIPVQETSPVETAEFTPPEV
jgi:hypothetical protein